MISKTFHVIHINIYVQIKLLPCDFKLNIQQENKYCKKVVIKSNPFVSAQKQRIRNIKNIICIIF